MTQEKKPRVHVIRPKPDEKKGEGVEVISTSHPEDPVGKVLPRPPEALAIATEIRRS